MPRLYVDRECLQRMVEELVSVLERHLNEAIGNQSSGGERNAKQASQKWLSTAEAAVRMGLSYQTLCNWRATKDPRRPRAHKSGRLVRYKASDIDRWIEDNTDQA